jgi:hypothetical protein
MLPYFSCSAGMFELEGSLAERPRRCSTGVQEECLVEVSAGI